MSVEGILACEVERDFVAVRGADATSFLQGQVSQDVEALDAGASAWSFVLQPTGKVDVLARVHRINDTSFVLDTDAGSGDRLLARLARFKLRVDVQLDRVGWRAVALRGTGIGLAPGPGVLVGWWGSTTEVDLVGEAVEPPPGAVAIEAVAYERLRVEAGWPAMDHELTEDTIPAESGVVPVTVSFTKGCFTGQELVARIDSRGGNVPRHLRRLRWDVDAGVAEGDRLVLDGKEVGWITTAVGDVGLGYVARAVEVPASVLAVTTAGDTAVAVEAIPSP